MLRLLYNGGCPNCGGPISDERALSGIPCERCLPISPSSLPSERKIEAIYNLLVEYDSLKAYWRIYDYNEQASIVEDFFRKKVGKNPWGLQRYWIRRFIEGESFSMSAPTGLGKSTTLTAVSLYNTEIGKSVYYLTPTKSLADQVCKKMRELGYNPSCNGIDDSNLIVTTLNYLNRNFEKVKDRRFDLVAVDDADAIIKSGKTTDKVAHLLGIGNEVMELSMKLVRLRHLYSFLRVVRPEEANGVVSQIEEIASRLVEVRGTFSQLIVASATARPRGVKQEAIKYLLGFEPSTIQFYMRNIVDTYSTSPLAEVIKKLGKGGLILVSKEYGREKLKEVISTVESLGFTAGLAVSGRKFMEKFSQGKTDILVGTASYYGVAVRGLDEPKLLRYVIFYGVPKSRVKILEALKNPLNVMRVGRLLSVTDEEYEKRVISTSPAELQAIRIASAKGERLEGKLGELQKLTDSYAEAIMKSINGSGDYVKGEGFVIRREGDTYYMVFPDQMTYIQGSGRSSRLLDGKLTLGLALTIVDDWNIYDILKKKLRFYIDDFEPRDFEGIDLDSIRSSMENSRLGDGKSFTIKTSLLVVESPTKAKAIARMFGNPIRRYFGDVVGYETIISDQDTATSRLVTILATRGHVTDLTLDNVGDYGVIIRDNEDIEPVYSRLQRCPSCNRILSTDQAKCSYCGKELLNHSSKVIEPLRKIAQEVDEVLVATDPDTEGEKIAHDVAVFISPFNSNIFRIKYHAVTKDEIIRALKSPEKINKFLVESQVVRRIEDRWIGFRLSSVLKSRFGDPNHGAGRVQTPVLGWITNRTKEYKDNLGWIVTLKIGDLKINKHFKGKRDANAFIKEIGTVKVNLVERKTEALSPLPPFTTDTLLQEAGMRFSISPDLIMSIAQQLFESGLITYHRTESIHVSPSGIGIAKSYLERVGKKDLFMGRQWGPEGTHEAIRPTRAMDTEDLKRELRDNPFKFPVKITGLHIALYDLIFRRFIGSQTVHGILVKGVYSIKINNDEEYTREVPIEVTGGPSEIYPSRIYKVPLGEVRPDVSIRRGSTVNMLGYSEIIAQMKSKEIGRPSTYAKTLSQLKRHGYVVESKKRKVLIATKRGSEVYSYLSSKFPEMVSEERTSLLLKTMDQLAEGNVEVGEVLKSLHSEVSRILI